MSEIALKSVNNIPKITNLPAPLHWQDNLSVQKLLDIIASILAEEYIEIAKQNPDVFSNGGEK